MSELLKNLNEAQRAAVTGFEEASLIVAGAGSGKTRVLTSRIAYMLQQGVQPWRILALTFTNKAAAEMRERIATMVSPELSSRLWMGTFHSIFLRILRRESEALGYPSSFTVYDTDDSRNLLKQIIKEMDLDPEKYKPAAVGARISLAKNHLVTPGAYEANVSYIAEDRERKVPELHEIYRRYAQRCRENGAMDFDDLLLNTNILFKDFPAILAKYQAQFAYILVDEYQDTNYAQYIIIRRLADGHGRVCVVGDDAQSIYSFRGARLENILRFRNDYPDAKTYKLEQNYRSTQTIVDAANSVIEKNRNRIDKRCFSEAAQGEKIRVIKAYTDKEEAALVADDVRAAVRDTGAGWNEAAVLYRTNMQSRGLEEAFRRRGIPYRIYGGMSFYQRKEVKDVLAYIQLTVNPKDDIAFRRVVNYPARGIGDVTIARIATLAAAAGTGMLETAATGDLKAAGLNAGTEQRVRAFAEMISSLAAAQENMGLYEFGLEVATRSGIIGGYRLEKTPEAQSALDNIEELLNSMQTFSEQDDRVMAFDDEGNPVEEEVYKPSVGEWLQSITLLTDQDNDKKGSGDTVTLMTVHAAKGLEYRFVYIVGLEENLFPSQMSMDGAEGIEEERRLFYVALTRAKERAVLSFSQTRFRWGNMEFCRPSRFLSEIDPGYLDMPFDLEDMDGGGPAAILRRNYEAHNARGYGQGGGQQYGKGGDSRVGGRGSYPESGRGYPGSRGGYGQGAPNPPSERVEMPKPSANFRKLGSAPAVPTGGSAGRPACDADLTAGQRVTHAKFGEGTIEAVEHMVNDKKVTVRFDDPVAGRKTLLCKFARLTVLG